VLKKETEGGAWMESLIGRVPPLAAAVPVAAEPISVLLVDPESAERFLPSLRGRFEVTAVSSEAQAIRALRAFEPTLVITELMLPEGDGVSLCRHAKALTSTPCAVLATTANAERVPDALLAGCDAVLVKPFAQNLLYARIGRLLRGRATASAAALIPQRMPGGTNTVSPDVHCPSCAVAGAVNFDALSLRRRWFACLSCRHVWTGLTP
jgi:DNA-binding response OmpR family regulator